MECKYYTAQEVSDLTGFKKVKAYDLIKKMNIEIKEIYRNKPEHEQPLIINGKILKEYFNKKMEV